ncbi:hypothetical protein RRG08_007970 [Elysia crispata]|uniref:Uncharacterized protein n=1 Tax=Elysia crispata TaxID=231223 RepID=A0AAE0ZQ09_9GAST|nr:hypothetical protein RRG08_007970 [Elysia crispata]
MGRDISAGVPTSQARSAGGERQYCVLAIPALQRKQLSQRLVSFSVCKTKMCSPIITHNQLMTLISDLPSSSNTSDLTCVMQETHSQATGATFRNYPAFLERRRWQDELKESTE